MTLETEAPVRLHGELRDDRQSQAVVGLLSATWLQAVSCSLSLPTGNTSVFIMQKVLAFQSL